MGAQQETEISLSFNEQTLFFNRTNRTYGKTATDTSDVSQAPGQNAVGHKSRSFNEQNFDNVEI